MKIALLQLNPTIGDLDGNAQKIAAGAARAGREGADLVVATEMALTGYPPRDLLLNEDFIEAAWRRLANLAEETAGGPAVLVGLAEPNSDPVGRPLFNAAALLKGGQVRDRFHKTLLPTYDVFDEDRYFEAALGPQILELDGRVLGVTICEDVWTAETIHGRQRYRVDPIAELVNAGAEAVLNLSASPFSAGKQRFREKMLIRLALRAGRPFFYVNPVGGADDLIFDGRSLVLDGAGRLAVRGRAFAEDLIVVDLDQVAAGTDQPLGLDETSPESEIWEALTLGVRDYAAKCGFKGVLLGLSGGIDSSLTAAVAVEALGPDKVLGVLMPSSFSSQGSIDDSLALAANLGIQTHTLPIADIVAAFEKSLAPVFAGRKPDVTEENIQARARGNLLMAVSNKFGSLLLTTGNKSELAVGYCTMYGDMAGGLAVIADVPKTMVYRLCRWLNREKGRPVIPEPVLTKPPSAELRPDQTDQDSLPDYDLLDQILHRHVEEHQSIEQIIAAGFEAETVRRVVRLVRIAEFKRRQAAPGLKVTDTAFGTGWRMPIARRGWQA